MRNLFVLSCLLLGIFLQASATSKEEVEPQKIKSRGYLGVKLAGLKLAQVLKGSAAEKAGLEAGDLILALDGKKIVDRAGLIKGLANKSSGDSVVFKYQREEKISEAKVVLGVRPPSSMSEKMKRLMAMKLQAPRFYERESVPLEIKAALTSGLNWLAKQQQPNGLLPAGPAFPGYKQRFHVAVTSLAGMALLSGNAHPKETALALEFILSCCQENGYIYSGKPSFKGMWEHGLATQFLAEMLIHKQKQNQKADVLRKKLEHAVAFILYAQNLEGGWGYRGSPDPHAEVGPGQAQLDALFLARRAGLQVPENVITKGLKSQCVLMLPPGERTVQGEWRSFSYEANAFVLASLLAWKTRPDTKGYLEALEGVSLEDYFKSYTEQTSFKGVYWATGNHTLGLFYTALAYRRRGVAHRKSFKQWHTKVASGLARHQNKAGAWKGWFGDVYGTSLACLTLAASGDGLETFRETSGTASSKASVIKGKAQRVKLDPKSVLNLNYVLKKSKTDQGWHGFEKTIQKVGLKQGAKQWSGSDLAGLFPETPVAEGQVWEVKGTTISKLFEPFHRHARGLLEVQVTKVDGEVLDANLRLLLKCGKDDATHISTVSMRGRMQVNLKTNRVTLFELKTITGCIRVQEASNAYVALNDIRFEVELAKAEGK